MHPLRATPRAATPKGPGRRSGRGRPPPRTHRGGAREVRAAKHPPARRSKASRAELDRLSKTLAWTRPVERKPTAAGLPSLRQLRVLMVGWEFPPHHTGGLGVHCYELVKELTRLGHRVTFVSPFSGPFTPVAGVEFRWPGDPKGNGVRYPPAYWSGELEGSPFEEPMDGYNAWIAGLTPSGPVDVVHVHDWFGTVGATALARRLSVPLVMTVHSTEYDRSLGHPWARVLEREQYGIDQAERVIVVSRHLGRQLVDRYGADPAKVRVIYNAVRPSERLAPLEQARGMVLYLGRLAAMKGVDTFLRAAARVAASVPEVLFVVAGEGPEYPRLLTLAAHLGVSERVLFLGHVTEEERPVLLASASVFVLPSVVEPFGIAALEAMAAGVPAIVSKTSGIAEIAESVFAVDFWDVDEFASRILELLRYPVLRHSMGEAGHWESLREGWPERALQTLGVYAETLRDRRRLG